MKLEFSLSSLNEKAPYRLESSGQYSFSFITEQGKRYEIGFIQDLMISDEGIYQFFISTEDKFKTAPDIKIQQTVMVVMTEFFKTQGVVLDYICATEDNRQAARDRKFHRWFEQAMDKDQYCMRSMSVEIDGICYYASVILRKDNPRYNAVMEAVDRFIADFQDKITN